MIIISHNFLEVTNIEIDGEFLQFNSKQYIGEIIYNLAAISEKEIIVWCHEQVKSEINKEYISSVFFHESLIFTYNPFDPFLSNAIGYIEDSPFININKKVQYPTWQMSSYAGAILGKTIRAIKPHLWKNKSFDYLLCSIAKTYQPFGLFCYSDPSLIKKEVLINVPKATSLQIFSFVKKHYKHIWIYLLLLNFVLFKKKVFLFPFFYALLFVKKNVLNDIIYFNSGGSNEVDWENETIDVVIPTMGRKKYLYGVLCNLREQKHLPNQIIIVEQNPNVESVSELDFLKSEKWPFEIKHLFTHKTGACQARNKALLQIKNKWCFFADDDIVLEKNFLYEAVKKINKYYAKGAVFSCLLPGVKNESQIISQTTIFGSGCSIVLSKSIEGLFFNEKLEYGFGEDTEFGMQLRRNGIDLIYFPLPEIVHLKAPIGGFRTKFIHPWAEEKNKPVPSPTILYYKTVFYTKEQIEGYKIILFFKLNSWKIFKLKSFLEHWNVSLKWVLILKGND